ncbi:MAG TPA: MarR family transcriptional regulator [Pseudonocardia sp.]
MPRPSTTRAASHPDKAGTARAEATLVELERGVGAASRWLNSRHIRGRIAAAIGVDLSPASLRLLEHLESAGPSRLSYLAECEQIDRSTATVRVQVLERAGYVDRKADADDARASVIALNASSRKLLKRLRTARRELLAEVLSDLDPTELQRTADVLQRFERDMLRGWQESQR